MPDSLQNATLWIREVRLVLLKPGTQGFLVIFYFCVFEHFYNEVIQTNCKAILLLIRPKTKTKTKNPALRDSFFGSLNCEHKNRHKYNPAVAGWGERGGQSADCGNGATAHHLYSRAWGGPWTCGPESLASRARELGPTAQLSH